MYKTLETAEYLNSHREKVRDFTDKVNTIIKQTFGENPDIKQFINTANIRAFNHDKDKLDKYNILQLYSNRDELDNELDMQEYKNSHKQEQPHHVEFFIKNNEDMNINDLYEFMGDIYSSTLLRNKNAYDELLDERDKANFSDYYLFIILNTYGLINMRFKSQILSKYPNPKTTDTFIDLLRYHIIKKNKLPRFINVK